jgi:tetratricopeptide (TPR) repeat protein
LIVALQRRFLLGRRISILKFRQGDEMKKYLMVLTVLGSLLFSNSIFAATEDELKMMTTEARGAIALGDDEKAISLCDEVLKLDPNFPSAYAARARAKLNLEDDAGALQDANRAVELSATYSATFIDPAYYVKAALLVLDEQQTDLQPALEFITKAITLTQFTPVPAYYELRANIHKTMGNQERADADFAKMDEVLKAQ